MPKARSCVREVVTSPTSAAFTLGQQSSNAVQTTSVTTWTPSTVTLNSVTAGSLLLSYGIWWDGQNNTGGTTPAPTDTNGTFTRAANAAPVNPTAPTPVPGWPVNAQICYILSANSGTHTVTPPLIDTSGDGYFFIAEFRAAGKTWSLIDSGNQFDGSASAGGVQSSTVSTASTLTGVGDLVTALVAIDGNPTSFGVGNPTSGYTVQLTTVTSAINISGGAGYKAATFGGTQSAAWSWSDAAAQIARSVIASFRAS